MAGQLMMMTMMIMMMSECTVTTLTDDDNDEGEEFAEVLKKLNVTSLGSMPAGSKWYYENMEECLEALGPAATGPEDGGVYCPGTWDKVLCWAATPANTTVSLSCPPLRGLDQSKFGYKTCGPFGQWEGKEPGDYSKPQGWSNYSDCYTVEAKKLYDKFFSHSSPEIMKEIANGARVMEMVGLSISFLSLAISITIFCYFRALRCDRTRIHRNLFVAILIHVGLQLTVHIDERIARLMGSVGGTTSEETGTIYDTAVLCEIVYVVVEYTKTVMFMWMFIEGFYLHNMLVVSVFSSRPNYIMFYLAGWGLPVWLVIAWATVNGIYNKEKCWFGYTFRPYYWILEGPRVAIIAVNLFFLLNIIRVLVTKLRASNSTEAVQVRKAVKAAIVLLPLLGVNNFLAMVEIPMNSHIEFGVWSYLSHFLLSFQGFFIALLYCFLNGEVQQILRKKWSRHRQGRRGMSSSRYRNSRTMSTGMWQSEMSTVQVNTPLTGSQNLSVKKKPKPDEIKMDEFDINGRVPCLLDHNHKAEDNSDDDKT